MCYFGGTHSSGFLNDTSVLSFLKKRFCFMSLSATPFPFTFPQTVHISLIWHLINNRPCFPQIFLQPNPIILGVWSLICLRSEHCAIKMQRKSCSDSMANQIWICISDIRFHTNTHRWGVGGWGFPDITLAVLWLQNLVLINCRIWFWLSALRTDSIPVEQLPHGQHH